MKSDHSDTEKAASLALELIRKYIINVPTRALNVLLTATEHPLSWMQVSLVRTRKNIIREGMRNYFLTTPKEQVEQDIKQKSFNLTSGYMEIELVTESEKEDVLSFIFKQKETHNKIGAYKKDNQLIVFRCDDKGKEESRALTFHELPIDIQNKINKYYANPNQNMSLVNDQKIITPIAQLCGFELPKKSYSLNEVIHNLSEKDGLRKTEIFQLLDMSAISDLDEMKENVIYLKIQDDDIEYACINEHNEQQRGKINWVPFIEHNYYKLMSEFKDEFSDDSDSDDYETIKTAIQNEKNFEKIEPFLFDYLTEIGVISSGQTNREYNKKQAIENVAKNTVNTGSGNCYEIAHLGFVFLMEQEEFKEKKLRMELIGFEKPSHTIVIVGRAEGSDIKDPSTWGKDAAILDGWMGENGDCFNVAEAYEPLNLSLSELNKKCKTAIDTTRALLLHFFVVGNPIEMYEDFVGCGHSKYWDNKRMQSHQPKKLMDWQTYSSKQSLHMKKK